MPKTSKGLSASAVRRILLFACAAAIVGVEIAFRAFIPLTQTLNTVYQTLSRTLGGLACVIFMLEFSFGKIMHPLGNKRWLGILAVLPAFVIAINNFPFIALATGDCSFNVDLPTALLFAVFCLSIGFFEEMAFRGCALMFLLRKRHNTRLGIFVAILLSSVVFGLVHLVNLFETSPIAVLLQIGYSALIGALCSVVLLVTHNIWLCVLLHGLYNFAGNVIAVTWTNAQMIFTAAVAVPVTIYTVWLFFRIPVESVGLMFEQKAEEKIEN